MLPEAYSAYPYFVHTSSKPYDFGHECQVEHDKEIPPIAVSLVPASGTMVNLYHTMNSFSAEIRSRMEIPCWNLYQPG